MVHRPLPVAGHTPGARLCAPTRLTRLLVNPTKGAAWPLSPSSSYRQIAPRLPLDDKTPRRHDTTPRSFDNSVRRQPPTSNITAALPPTNRWSPPTRPTLAADRLGWQRQRRRGNHDGRAKGRLATGARRQQKRGHAQRLVVYLVRRSAPLCRPWPRSAGVVACPAQGRLGPPGSQGPNHRAAVVASERRRRLPDRPLALPGVPQRRLLSVALRLRRRLVLCDNRRHSLGVWSGGMVCLSGRRLW